MAGSGTARPTGVTILAALAFIGGILGILGSLAILAGGVVVTAVGGGGLGGLLFLTGLATLVLSIVDIILGYGAWTLKTWAWQLGYILMALNVLVGLLTVIAGGGLFSFLITLVIAGIIAYYLDTPVVRTAFSAPQAGFPVVGNALDPYLQRIRSRS
jgi:hypothetical protein